MSPMSRTDTTQISDERLAELIGMADVDAESYEHQARGDTGAPEYRWAQTARDEANALRELQRCRAEGSPAFQPRRVFYRGRGYGMGSQWGIDSLQNAIRREGHE